MTGECRAELRRLIDQARRAAISRAHARLDNTPAGHGYGRGCRCDACRRVNSDRKRRWRARQKAAA